jgi:hypothetical protein
LQRKLTVVNALMRILILNGSTGVEPHVQNQTLSAAKKIKREQEATMSTGNAADRVAYLFAGPEWLATLNAGLPGIGGGFLGIAVGVIALVTPAAAMLALVLLFAAYVLVDCVFAIVAALRAARQHERWRWLILEGVADILAGTITVLWPGIAVLAIVLLAAAWALARSWRSRPFV